MKTKKTKHNERMARHEQARLDTQEIEFKATTIRQSINWDQATISKRFATSQSTRQSKPKDTNKTTFFYNQGDKPRHGKTVNLTGLHNIGYPLKPAKGKRVIKPKL